jgi:hypothetical protein
MPRRLWISRIATACLVLVNRQPALPHAFDRHRGGLPDQAFDHFHGVPHRQHASDDDAPSVKSPS